MNTSIEIINLSGKVFGTFDYNEQDNKNTKLEKLEKVLYNDKTKNNCLENNKIIVLMNDLEIYYINFIYVENNKLYFSKYKLLSNDLINNTYLNIVFMDIPINISHIPININNIDIYDFYIVHSIENYTIHLSDAYCNACPAFLIASNTTSESSFNLLDANSKLYPLYLTAFNTTSLSALQLIDA